MALGHESHHFHLVSSLTCLLCCTGADPTLGLRLLKICSPVKSRRTVCRAAEQYFCAQRYQNNPYIFGQSGIIISALRQAPFTLCVPQHYEYLKIKAFFKFDRQGTSHRTLRVTYEHRNGSSLPGRAVQYFTNTQTVLTFSDSVMSCFHLASCPLCLLCACPTQPPALS